jgi:hypothetical protein
VGRLSTCCLPGRSSSRPPLLHRPPHHQARSSVTTPSLLLPWAICGFGFWQSPTAHSGALLSRRHQLQAPTPWPWQVGSSQWGSSSKQPERTSSANRQSQASGSYLTHHALASAFQTPPALPLPLPLAAGLWGAHPRAPGVVPPRSHPPPPPPSEYTPMSTVLVLQLRQGLYSELICARLHTCQRAK